MSKQPDTQPSQETENGELVENPFQSEAQRKFLFAKHPEVAREFAAKTPKGAKLPERKKARVANAQKWSKKVKDFMSRKRGKPRQEKSHSNPLRIDPTRSAMVRKQFESHLEREFAKLYKDIAHLLVDEDAFGLTEKGKGQVEAPTWLTGNAFCATGEGGGVDDSCPPGEKGAFKSKAKVKIIAAKSENVPGRLKMILGEKSTTNDVATLLGVPDDATVAVAGAGRRTGNNYTPEIIAEINSDGKTHVEGTRVFGINTDGDRYIHNDGLYIRPTGTGLGTQIFANEVSAAQERGFKYIVTEAGKGGGMNGYYTWPLLGYDQPLSTMYETRNLAKKDYPQAKTVLDILQSPGGRKWWKEHGCSMAEAKFDLTPNSRSMRVLKAYIDERQKHGRGIKNVPLLNKLPNYGQNPDRKKQEEIDLNPYEKAALAAAWNKIEAGQLLANVGDQKPVKQMSREQQAAVFEHMIEDGEYDPKIVAEMQEKAGPPKMPEARAEAERMKAVAPIKGPEKGKQPGLAGEEGIGFKAPTKESSFDIKKPGDHVWTAEEKAAAKSARVARKGHEEHHGKHVQISHLAHSHEGFNEAVEVAEAFGGSNEAHEAVQHAHAAASALHEAHETTSAVRDFQDTHEAASHASKAAHKVHEAVSEAHEAASTAHEASEAQEAAEHGASAAEGMAIVARHLYPHAVKAVTKLIEHVPGGANVALAITNLHQGLKTANDKMLRYAMMRYGKHTVQAAMAAGVFMSGHAMNMVGVPSVVQKALPATHLIGALPLLGLAEAGLRLGLIHRNSALEKSLRYVGTWVHAIKHAYHESAAGKALGKLNKAVGEAGGKMSTAMHKAARKAGRTWAEKKKERESLKESLKLNLRANTEDQYLLDDQSLGLAENAFCPTGEGGGVDPTCSPKDTGGVAPGKGTEYYEPALVARVRKEASQIGFSDSAPPPRPGSIFHEPHLPPLSREQPVNPRYRGDPEDIEDEDIENEMTRRERNDMDESLNESCFAALENLNYESDVSEEKVAKEEGLDSESLVEKVHDLIDIHGGGEAERLHEDLASVHRSNEDSFGSDYLKQVNSQLRNPPANLRDAISEYSVEVKHDLESAYEKAQASEREDQERDFLDNYNDSNDRHEYLRQFLRDNPERFAPPEEPEEGEEHLVAAPTPAPEPPSPAPEPPKPPETMKSDIWYKKAGDEHVCQITLGNGEPYYINLSQGDRGGLRVDYVSFNDKHGSFSVTGAGAAHEVFGKVSSALTAWLMKNKPDGMTFSASGGRVSTSKQGGSRQKLYDRLVKTLARVMPEYKAVTTKSSDTKSYYVFKREHEDKARSYIAAHQTDTVDVLVNTQYILDPAWWTPRGWVSNAFCPTGEGGGQDNSCSPAKKSETVAGIITKEAAKIKFSQEKVEDPTSSGDMDDPDDDLIERQMTQNERRMMEMHLEEMARDAADTDLENYEADVNPSSVADDAGYSKSECDDKVNDLIDEYGGDQAERLKEEAEGASRRGHNHLYGDSYIGHIRESLTDSPGSLEDALQEYQDEAENSIRDAVDEAEQSERDEAHHQYMRDYDDSSDRHEYLQSFVKEHPDRFQKSTELPELGTWYNSIDSEKEEFCEVKTSADDPYYINVVRKDIAGHLSADMAFRDAEGSFDITKAGHAHELFTKVASAMAAWLNHNKPDVLTFSAKEKSRRKLYDRLCQSLAAVAPDYMAVASGDTSASFRQYGIVRRTARQEMEKIHQDRHFGEPLDVLVNLRWEHPSLLWFTPLGWREDPTVNAGPGQMSKDQMAAMFEHMMEKGTYKPELAKEWQERQGPPKMVEAKAESERLQSIGRTNMGLPEKGKGRSGGSKGPEGANASIIKQLLFKMKNLVREKVDIEGVRELHKKAAEEHRQKASEATDDETRKEHEDAAQEHEEHSKKSNEEVYQEGRSRQHIHQTLNAAIQSSGLKDFGHLHEAVRGLTGPALERIAANLKEVHLHESTAKLGEFTGRGANDAKAAGSYKTGTIHLAQHKWLDEDKEDANSPVKRSKDRKAEERGSLIHEMAHALDKKTTLSGDEILSDTPEWERAWTDEIHAKGGAGVSKYSTEDRTEGFAEFFRVAHMKGANRAALKKSHPQAYGILEKHGLISKGAATANKKFAVNEQPPEIFTHKIKLRDGSHVDAKFDTTPEGHIKIDPTDLARTLISKSHEHLTRMLMKYAKHFVRNERAEAVIAKWVENEHLCWGRPCPKGMHQFDSGVVSYKKATGIAQKEEEEKYAHPHHALHKSGEAFHHLGHLVGGAVEAKDIADILGGGHRITAAAAAHVAAAQEAIGSPTVALSAAIAPHLYQPVYDAVNTVMDHVPGALAAGMALHLINHKLKKFSVGSMQGASDRWGPNLVAAGVGASKMIGPAALEAVGVPKNLVRAIPGASLIAALPMVIIAEAAKRAGLAGKDTKLDAAMGHVNHHVGTWLNAIKDVLHKNLGKQALKKAANIIGEATMGRGSPLSGLGASLNREVTPEEVGDQILREIYAEFLRLLLKYHKYLGDKQEILSADILGQKAPEAVTVNTGLIPVPDIRQPNHFSCGSACAMSVGRGLYGLGPETIEEWEEALGTTLAKSTSPHAIVNYLRSLGLQVEEIGQVVEPGGADA